MIALRSLLPTLRGQLLVLWMVSITLSLLLVWGVFWLLLNQLHQEMAERKIAATLVVLEEDLRGRAEQLEQLVTRTAQDGELVASLYMIDKFQQPYSYQPLVFNPVKERLSEQLAERLLVTAIDLIALYSSDLTLAAFALHGGDQAGYLVFTEGRPEVRLRLQRSGGFLSQPPPAELQPLAPGRVTDQGLHLYASGEHYLIGYRRPLYRNPAGSEVVGSIAAAVALDSQFIAAFSQRHGGRFAMSADGYHWSGDLGAIHGVQMATAPQSAAAPSFSFTPIHYATVAGHFVGTTRITTTHGTGLHLLFAVEKDLRLFGALYVFHNALLVTLLLVAALLIPLGILLLTRLINQPLHDLSKGVMEFKEGHFEPLVSPSSSNEIRSLTQSFNEMASRVLARERELLEMSQQLAQSRDRLDLVVRNTSAGIWDWNLESGVTNFSERWAELAGYRREELAPITLATWQRLLHPDDLQASQRALLAHWRGESERYQCEVRIRHKQGHWVWLLDTGKMVEWSADGIPVRMVGIHQDITSRKEVEIALQQNLEELRSARQRSLTMLHELEQARDAAEQADQRKAHRLHQLHTQIDQLVTTLQPLQQQELPAQQRAQLLSHALEQLASLVEQLDSQLGKKTRQPERVAGINIAEGVARVMGNRLLYERLVADFPGRYTPLLQQIKQRLAAAEYAAAASAVHTLAGSAGNLGMMPLRRAAKALQQALESGRPSAPLWHHLEQHFDEVVASIAQLALPPSSVTMAESSEPWSRAGEEAMRAERESLHRLLALLHDRDLQAAECYRQLLEQVSEPNARAQLEPLDGHIERLDYATAQAQLRAILLACDLEQSEREEGE